MQDLKLLSLQERAIRVGYLAQAPEVAWPISVRELAALGRFPHGTQSALDTVPLLDEALCKVGLTALKDRPLDSLSGGERTRAHLARLLVGQHRALLVDEPIAALDPSYQLGILSLFRALAREGIAVALVLHDLALAAQFCDRLLILQGGRAVAQGLPAEVLTPALLAEAFNVRGVWHHESGALLGFAHITVQRP